MLLFKCYCKLTIPRFESAQKIISKLQSQIRYFDEELELQMDIAKFYLDWSISLKAIKWQDIFEERQRVSQYKDFATQALQILLQVEKMYNRISDSERPNILTHELQYLIAQSHYNLWEYDEAMGRIDQAIELATSAEARKAISHYIWFKEEKISASRDEYSHQSQNKVRKRNRR
jgi:tetratricopeptide (TPR) repeat protein